MITFGRGACSAPAARAAATNSSPTDATRRTGFTKTFRPEWKSDFMVDRWFGTGKS
jgi:hypothetical protein